MAREWMHDQDPRHRAWAAYWAGKYGITALIPELVQNLSSYSLGNAPLLYPLPEEDAAIQSVADALIRLNAAVPATATMNLYPKFPAQAVILLARTENLDPTSLLRIFDDSKITTVWLAAANLLAVDHPALIAKRLMEGFTARVHVTVVNPQKVTPEDIGFGRGCASDFAIGPAYGANWPKIWEYRLETDHQELPVLALGRINVYYWHWETPDYIPHPDSGSCGTDGFAQALLAQLAGGPPQTFVLRSEPTKTVVFLSESQYMADVGDFLRHQKRAFEQLAKIFTEGGLLNPVDASSLNLHASLEVDDQRSKRTSLPAIDLSGLGIIERRPD